MDETDEKILSILKEDGRASYTEIADQLDVTEATVRNRMKRMEEEGTIKGFTVEIDRESQVKAFVLVEIDAAINIEEVIASFPEDIEIYELAGRYDIIFKVSERSTSDLNGKVDSIRAINGVENTETFMVLEER